MYNSATIFEHDYGFFYFMNRNFLIKKDKYEWAFIIFVVNYIIIKIDNRFIFCIFNVTMLRRKRDE